MKRSTAPWGFSEPPAPGAPAAPNLQSPFGGMLGRELARLCDIEESRRIRCDECAFRSGTIPNSCESTLMDAVKCAIEGVPFYCHKSLGDVPCAGWVLLSRVRR